MGFNSSRDGAFKLAVLSNLHKVVDSTFTYYYNNNVRNDGDERDAHIFTAEATPSEDSDDNEKTHKRLI